VSGICRVATNRWIPHIDVSEGGNGDSPWQDDGTVVRLKQLSDDVAIGTSTMVGNERLRVSGGIRTDDPSALAAYLELAQGLNAPVSGAGTFRLRYNDALNRAEISENGGPWLPLIGAAPLPTALVSSVYSCPSGVSVGDAVYLSAADTVDQADADDLTKIPCIGVVISKPTSTSCQVQYYGELSGFAGLAPGGTIYLAKTAGALTQVAPTAVGDVVQRIGFARSTTVAVLQITQETTTLE
jgi:hypothetical protein